MSERGLKIYHLIICWLSILTAMIVLFFEYLFSMFGPLTVIASLIMLIVAAVGSWLNYIDLKDKYYHG